MHRLLTSSFILLVTFTVNVIAYDDSVAKSLQDIGIVPNLIRKAPPYLARVKYGNTDIVLGTKMKQPELLLPPTVSWVADCNENYTLLMMGSIPGDPDAPPGESPLLGPVLHWMVINIPGADVAKGESLSTYLPPIPIGVDHRYLFLVYKQSSPLQFDLLRKVEASIVVNRLRFSVEDFAKKYNLGDPVAGNFLRTEIASQLPVLPSILGKIY